VVNSLQLEELDLIWMKNRASETDGSHPLEKLSLVALELGIAMLQAYVFTILTCSYPKDSIYLH
jgi:F0F1-type ATP synthase membrane subunit a